MNEDFDLEGFHAAVAHAMTLGYIVDSQRVEGGMAVRLITRPKFIRQQVTRLCDVLTKAALAHVERAVADVDETPGDPIFERKQIGLNVHAIIKEAMLAGFAAADSASRDGFQSTDTFDGLDMDENGEQGEDVVES